MIKANLVSDFLEWNAAYNPDRIAIVWEGQKWTYAFLNAQANRVGHWLRETGVRSGDRVVLCGHNTPHLVASLFGVLKAGAIAVPLHPRTSLAALAFIVRNCVPAAIITESDLVRLFFQSCRGEDKPLLVTSTTGSVSPWEGAATSWDMLGSLPDEPPVKDVSPDDLALIIYTSGSTADPKGVMEPHRQVVFAVQAINAVLRNTSEDVVLCGLPFSFDYGLYQIFLAFQAGARLVLERDFSFPLAIPRILKEQGVTGFPGVPSLFAVLLRSRLLERVELPQLRYITSTGDIWPPAHIRALRNILPHVTIFPMYGLTECKRVSIIPQGYLDGHETSVGLPLPGTNVFVVDEKGQEVPRGMVGELVVRGPHVMLGYWNDPAETARRFWFDSSTGERFLRTGDLFRIGEDGFLYFVGRKEMFIKSRGQKVSPTEIESVVSEIPGVAEVAATGIPDPVMGEAVCVFIVPTDAGVITPESVAQRCAQTLPPAAWPRHVFLLESALPRTMHGKIDRMQVRQMALAKTTIGH